MGSESSKSGARSNVDKPKNSWSVDDPELMKSFVKYGYRFVEVAVWARPLEGKAGIETGNVSSKLI